MEVTPLNLRDARISSNDGAQPHGRDTSAPKTNNQPTTPAQTAAPAAKAPATANLKVPDAAKVESNPLEDDVPRDPLTEMVAAHLRTVDPQLDPEAAARIAKLILDREENAENITSRWASSDTDPSLTSGHWDTAV